MEQKRYVVTPVFFHLALLDSCGMICDQFLVRKDMRPEGIVALIGVLDGDRIVVGLEAHTPDRMFQHFRQRTQFRRMGWQRFQVSALQLPTGGNGLGAPSNDRLPVGETIKVQV